MVQVKKKITQSKLDKVFAVSNFLRKFGIDITLESEFEQDLGLSSFQLVKMCAQLKKTSKIL